MRGRFTAAAVDFWEPFSQLWHDLSVWSQATFGSDVDRGPVGPLRHLSKEANEAVSAWQGGESRVRIEEEFADCFLLLLDASRRAGITPMTLVKAAAAKQAVNRSRSWPAPAPDETVEHVS